MIPHYLPSFLFDESTKFKSKHNALHSFSPANALSKDDPFLPLSSPNQQPKKKNIYLNHQSFLLLDKSSNIALIIAKLKQEGFEVFLIFDDCNQSTIASPVNDQLKFSDQNKNIKSIFSIDQSFIRTLNRQKDFTQIAEDLELAVDDSIILDSVQFQQVEKLLTDAVLTSHEVIKDHLVLELSNKTTSANIYEKLAFDLKEGLELKSLAMHDFYTFPFLQTDESIGKLSFPRNASLIELNTAFNKAIKNLKEANPLAISEIFRYSIDRAFNLDEGHKNLIVKQVLKFFWFLHPDFKELIANAEKLEEFKSKTPQAIAQELFTSEKTLLGENSENSALFPIHLIDNLVTSKEKYLEFCERSGFSVDSIDKAILLIFFSATEYFKNAQNLFYSQTVLGRLIPFISTQQLPTFTLKNPPTKENFVIVKTTLSNPAEYEISFDDFVDSFFTKISSEINLGREFGDAIIDQIFLSDVFKIEVYRFLDLQQQQKFHEKFNQILVEQHQQKIGNSNEDKKPESLTKILELIKKPFFKQSKYLPKISLATYQSLGLEQYLSTRDKIILFQHQLDDSRVKIFLQEAIIKEENKDYSNIEDVSPEMEDIFLQLHDVDRIDLSQYRFNSNFRRITSEFYRQKITMIAQDQYAKEPIHFGEDSDDFFNLMIKTIAGAHSTFPSAYNQKIRRLEDFGDYELFKPLKIKMNNLNFIDFLALERFVNSSAIDISKIVALEIINISGNELIQSRDLDNVEQILLSGVIAFFPNLQHLTINQKFESIARDVVASNPNITIATKIFFEEEIAQIVKKESNRFNSSAQSEITTSKKPQSRRRGDSLFFSRGNTTSRALQSSEIGTFNMDKVGEIIFRPTDFRSNDLHLRDNLLELKLDCAKLDQEWLVKSQSASLRVLSESELRNIQKFTTLDQVHNYQPSRSNNYTVCFFQQDLKVESSNTLISISPDNKIIGYYIDPNDSLLEFSIDDAGFYHVSTNKKCTIHYVIQGQELVHHNISENLDNLPIEQEIKEVIKQYVNSDFQLLTTYQSYTLPKYDLENANISDRNQKWLSSLFNCQNKGSCRHRVMAMSYALRNYQYSFRIIGINNNHVLLEIKDQNDKWYRINLGGEEANLQYDSASLAKSFPKQQIAKPESEILPKAVSDISSITHSLLTELYQLKTLDGDLDQLDSLLFETTNKSILLKTDHYQSLKNFLLYLEKKYQLKQQFSADTEQSLPILFYSNCLVIDKPEHFDCSKKTIVIAQKNEGSSEVISSEPVDEQCLATIEEKTEFSKFLEKASHNPHQKFPLIINYQEFSAKERVAFNSMFDQVQRAVNGNKIPDNVVIICIDDLRQQITDPAILSRFSKTYDLSRYSKQDIQKFIEEGSIEEPQETYYIEYDLEGFDDWYQKLFGRIIVDDQKIKWCKSDLVKKLESIFHSSQSEKKQITINLSNISQEKRIEVENLFAQARILGYVEHFGYKIKIPSNLQLKFAREDNLKSQFTFEKLLSAFSPAEEFVEGNLSLTIFKDCLASQNLPNDIHLINSQLFDQLLTIPKIVDEKYHEELGLIAFASTQDSKTLKIFVSEQLSKQQFYCLFSQAKKMKVNLEIYLSKDVKITDAKFEKFNSTRSENSIEEVIFEIDSSPKLQRIIVTNDLTQATEKICSNLDSDITINLVNVEDVLYQDLFECPNYKIESESIDDSQSLIFKFSKTISQIQEKLSSSSSSQAIILKGKLPKDLLSLLQPQILDLQKRFTNLYFVIEEEVNQTTRISSQLSWLDSSCYQVQHYQTQQKEKSQIIRENFPEIGAEIPEQSQKLAQEFIVDRKNTLEQLLQENSLLKIIGHSGVGKSSLMHEIAKNGLQNEGDVKIYHELSDIEDWAGDNHDNLKILVVDEFNIDGSLNWTMLRDFADCKLDDQSPKAKLNRQIFYKGKFHQLDEKHRIIFLGNPRNYGNRYQHQLFEEKDVKEWHLQDFSVAYIYEKILKEPIYDKIDSKVKDIIGNEEEFKKICLEKIKEYKQKNSKESSDQIDQESNIPEQTVRELQEEVLKIITKKLKEQSAKKLSRLGINRGFGIFDFIRKIFLGSFCFPVNKSHQRQYDELQLQHIQKPVAEISTKDFIATSSNKETLEELSLAIQIRQIQKMGIFPDQKLGTNGVIFEGDSGVGKSVMIEAVLQNQGIKKTEDLQEIEKQFSHISQNQDENNYYYYKIPASLDVSEIKRKLVQAYKLGIIVVFDEINTRIDEDLEKTINALLTGHYVEQGSTQELKPRSGFMIIGSVNSAQNAGRSKISPAIKHRCNIIKAKSLKEYTIDDFVKIISNFLSENKEDNQIQQSLSRPSGHSRLFFIKRFSFNKKIYPFNSSQTLDPKETIQRIATEFKECANSDPKFNLRALREKLPEIKDLINQEMQMGGQEIISNPILSVVP